MILEGLRTWLIDNVTEVSDLTDSQQVYINQADQGATDHVLLSEIDTDFHEVLDPDDDQNERTTQLDIDVKCSLAARAETIADAIIEALKNFTGTMGEREVLAIVLENKRTLSEPARTGQTRGRSVVEIEVTLQHTAV